LSTNSQRNQSEIIITRLLLDNISKSTELTRSSAIKAGPTVAARTTKPALTPGFVPVKALPEIVTVESTPPLAIAGLSGSSNIVYWSFEEVDQGALLLAEWPENMIVAPWPSERPVTVEVWVNPDGALANLNFTQEDLPISIKTALFDSINQYGFKPAIKDGTPVGNHRLLELLLTETSVPALAIR
jgi:hypothetical protein